MNPAASWKAYRSNFKKASPPAMPYVGVYLSDLTFIGDGNPDRVDGLINFQKRELEYRIIADVKAYQQTKYNFTKLEPIYTFLSQLPYFEEKVLYDLSLKYEPRNAQTVI